MIYSIHIGVNTTYVGHYNDNQNHVVLQIPTCISFKNEQILFGQEAVEYGDPQNTFYNFPIWRAKRFSKVQHLIDFYSYQIETDDIDNITFVFANGQRYYLEQLEALFIKYIQSQIGKKVSGFVLTTHPTSTHKERESINNSLLMSKSKLYRVLADSVQCAVKYTYLNKNEETKTLICIGFTHISLSITKFLLDEGIIECQSKESINSSGILEIEYQLSQYIVYTYFDKQIKIDKITKTEIYKQSQRIINDFLNNKYLENQEIPQFTIGTSKISLSTNLIFEIFNQQLNILYKVMEKIVFSLFCEKHIQFILYGEGKQYNGLLKIVEQFNYRSLQQIQKNKILYYDYNDITDGGSLYAGIFEGLNNQTLNEILLLDTLPYNIGVETSESKLAVMIPKNSTIPSLKRKTFSTFTDYQVQMNLKVYEGPSEEIRDCQYMGSLTIQQIIPDLKGIPKIIVEFLVDESGILSINYCEQKNNIEYNQYKKCTLFNSNPLYQDESTIQKLQNQVEKDSLNCSNILFNHIQLLKPQLSDEDAQQIENLIIKVKNSQYHYGELLQFYKILIEKKDKIVKI